MIESGGGPASARRRLFRAAVAVAVGGATLGSGCPVRQSERDPRESAWTEEVGLRTGESVTVDGGALTVLLAELDHGSRISELTIRLQSPEGGSVEETIEAVRNARYSSAVRLGAYAVRVIGYPGVDSVRLLVSRD